MTITLNGTTGITTPAGTVQGNLTTTGNTVLGDASTDTLNVANGDLIKDLPFEDLEPNLKTWEDTASYMSSMDLIITSCTSTAHMSAALGIETWVIVPVLPYYLWAVPKNKSAWYDNVTLFRQEKYGEWEAPLNAVKQALLERLQLKAVA